MANIRTRLANSLEKGDLLSTVRSTFKELLDSSVNGSSQSTCSARKDVYVFVLDHLETEDIAKDTGQQLVSILLVEADNLETKTASDIAYKILDKVKNGTASKGRSLELFPKLLSSMMESADGALEEKCGVDADKERSRLLDTLCTIRWPPNNVCALITMCRDIKLSNRELKMLFTKAFQTMKSMRPAELPPVIYQLIALSTKGHRGVVLNRVVMLFNDLDKEVAEKGDPSESDITVAIPRNELLQTEGTVMVHISFAIRQQQELGRELVDAVKTSLATASDSLMSPFCVAMLLSVSRIHGLQDQVFTLLKSAVTNSIKDIERWQCCRWIRETSAPVVKMEDLLQHTVRNSVQGWDSVLEGLVSFALCLMEGFSPKFPNASFGDLHSVQQQVCNIGSRLLIHIYEIHRIARKEIVKQILKSVITSSSTYSKHYIGILARLVRKTESRETVLDPDCIKTIEEVLNYLPFLPLAPAEDFMEAVQPLLKYSVSLKESLLVVLRNALLSKRTDGRCIAVKGYLLLLRNAEILDDALLSSQSSQPMSGSQVFVELHGTNMAASNEALCLEIIGNLRRCLTQQVEVRRNLYEGICAVFCTNEKLQLPILEFLLDHLLSLVLDDSNNPLPINLDKCLAQLPSGLTSIWEPVDSLLSALVLCYLRYKSSCDADGSTVSPVALKICDCLRSLALKTAKVEAGNLGIEKDADFSATSNAGSRNLCVLSLTARCCEVLLEFVFGAGDFSTQSCDQVLQLHSSRQSLLKTVAEKGGSSGAKRPHGKVPSATQGYFQSCMSLPSLLAMFKALHNDTLPSHQPGLAVLRDSIPFCKQILTASLQIMSSLLETSRCNGMCSVDYQEEVTNVLQGFGRSYLKQLQLACLRGQEREDSGSKGKSIVSLSLEGLQSILTLSTRLEEDKCLGILTFISSSEDTEASLSATSLHLIRKFQKLVNGALSDPPELDVLGMRDVVAMANIIQHLSTLLDEEMMADVLKWAYDICREQNRGKPQFVFACQILFWYSMCFNSA
jgi:Fanconi anemia group I protein